MHSPLLTMMRGNTHSFLALLLGGAVAFTGCGKDPETTATTTASATDDSTTTTTEGSVSDSSTSTSNGVTSNPTSGTDSDGVTGTTDGDCSFLECQDQGGGGTVECDIWAQDCPMDQKCMPWADDGGSAWNATKCSDVDPDAALVGDECEGGGVSGVDNCELGSMCYYVDNETNLGVCVPFCIGTPDAPTCADLTDQCSISNDGVLILCRKTCDPLLQDCQGSSSCLNAAGSDKFVCIADASGEAGAAGDPCEYLNSCDPGLLCLNASVIPDCQASGCCSEFCDLSDPNKDDTCSLKDKGVTCEPYYDEMMEPPPGLEDLGACYQPM